jgi:peptidoglycan/LPS O-acetylase OafA/YrhL
LHAPLYIKLRPVRNAYLAVDFFFALSGFVIAFSYEKRLQESLSLKDFMIARGIRLYPVYLLGMIAGTIPYFAFEYHLRLTRDILVRLIALFSLQTLMLPPLSLWNSPSMFPLDFPAWSMFFEMLANFGYALMVRRRLAGVRQIVPVILVSFGVLAYWLLRGGSLSVGSHTDGHGWLAIFRVAFSFLMGVLIFRIFRRQGTPHWPGPQSAMTAVAVALAMTLLLAGPFPAMRSRVFTLVTAAVLLPCLLYLGARCRLSPSWHRICTFLGDLSYPLYLLHVPCMGLLYLPVMIRLAHAHPATRYAFVPSIVVIAAVVSVLATKYYDVPLRRVLSRRYNAYLAERASVAASA